jgi:hypothetical protein
MRSTSLPIAATLAICSLARPASAGFDEFADSHSPRNFEVDADGLRLVFKGEVEVELHDIEGRGGPAHDSPTDTQTLGTRSPFVEIDSMWLALRLGLTPELGVNTITELTPRSAGVTAVWGDFRTLGPAGMRHRVEIGYHTPIVSIDRRTERYPLNGTIYWREPELHAVYELGAAFGDHLTVELGLSAAMVRPIVFSGVQDSRTSRGTINVVAYGPARPYSGNAPIFGGALRLRSHGVFATAFGFRGCLAAEAGTDELRNSFSRFQELPGFNDEALREQEDTLHWYGGRLGFEGFGLHLLAEGIASQESLLRRWGAYAQASYVVSLRPPHALMHSVEPLVRYELYRIRDATDVLPTGRALRTPAPSQAVTWSFMVTTAALIVQVYEEMVRLRVEYAWIDERNGVRALGIARQPLRNDELLVQLELRF